MCFIPICAATGVGAPMSDDASIRVLLLQGINVGGRNRLPMADQRALLTELGFKDLQTHIQSGNAVFPIPGGFLHRPAKPLRLQALHALAAPDERFALSDEAFCLHAPSGIGRSRLAARAETLLGVPMTMRNQRVTEAVARPAWQLL